MSCKWLLFLLHHAFCWKATRLKGGCSAAVSRCLTARFVLSLSGCSHWREGGKRRGRVVVGFGRGGTNSELNEPPGGLGHVRHPPTFPTCILPAVLRLLLCSPLCSSLSLFRSLSFWPPSLTKLDPGPTGPDPRTGPSQLAYQE